MTLRQGRVIGTTGHTLTGTHGIADIDQPQRQAPLDLDAIAEFNANQRRARDAYHDSQPMPCGTTAAYLRHKRAGEQPCQPCVDAERADARERYQRTKESK